MLIESRVVSRRRLLLVGGMAAVVGQQSPSAAAAGDTSDQPSWNNLDVSPDREVPLPDVKIERGKWTIVSSNLDEIYIYFPDAVRIAAPAVMLEGDYRDGIEHDLPVERPILKFYTRDSRVLCAAGVETELFAVDKKIQSTADSGVTLRMEVSSETMGPFISPSQRVTAKNYTMYVVGENGSAALEKLTAALLKPGTVSFVVMLGEREVYRIQSSTIGAGVAIDTARDEFTFRLAEKSKGRRDPSAGSSVGGGKVVCTAMNERYGFGQFRNKLWLAYAARHLSSYHERGYHRWALPLVRFAYSGDSPVRTWTRKAIEHMARERTADIWAELRSHRRRPLGRLYRAILEPMSWLIGRW